MEVSALMRRAVPVPEDGSGFADDPAEGGAGVAFLRADPFDEDGAALGGEGDTGRGRDCRMTIEDC